MLVRKNKRPYLDITYIIQFQTFRSVQAVIFDILYHLSQMIIYIAPFKI